MNLGKSGDFVFKDPWDRDSHGKSHNTMLGLSWRFPQWIMIVPNVWGNVNPELIIITGAWNCSNEGFSKDPQPTMTSNHDLQTDDPACCQPVASKVAFSHNVSGFPMRWLRWLPATVAIYWWSIGHSCYRDGPVVQSSRMWIMYGNPSHWKGMVQKAIPIPHWGEDWAIKTLEGLDCGTYVQARFNLIISLSYAWPHNLRGA